MLSLNATYIYSEGENEATKKKQFGLIRNSGNMKEKCCLFDLEKWVTFLEEEDTHC